MYAYERFIQTRNKCLCKPERSLCMPERGLYIPVIMFMYAGEWFIHTSDNVYVCLREVYTHQR